MKKKVHILKRHSIYMLFLLFFSLANVQAQVAVTVTSGATNVTPNLAATYSSFANLTAALNNITAMTGAVNIQLSGGTEVAPPKGFTIGSTTLNAALTASAGNGGYGGINITGIFVGENSPSNSTLVGGVGTATGASASPDGILKLVGADYIGLTYISFIDPTTNTTPTTAMEFGVALFKANPTDGCQHNYIDTNFFTMQRLNTIAGSGPMIGEAAIIIVNSIPTAATTSITPTSNSGASTDNDIRNNDINGGANGISLFGYPATAPYDFVDTRNSITGNYIRNFGGGIPAISSNGIITRAQWETDIEYNNVNNNDGLGVNHNSNLYGINIFNATNSNSITSNNVIKLQSGTATGGQVYGIYNSINTGGNVPGFSTTINNNTIDMAQPLLTTVGNMRGIYCISSSQILTISSNIISGLSPFAFTGFAYGIYTQGTATTTTITNNSIKNFNRTAATGVTYGILCQGTAATATATTGPTNVVADGNTIDNLTFTATDNNGIVLGINASVNTITNSINNNVVKNLTVGTSGTIYGIYDNGIAGTKVCQNNQVFNFSTPAGVGTSTNNAFYGIYYTNNAIAALNLDITGNSIYSLNNLGTGTNGEVYGIYCTALQPSSIYKNKIYDLSYGGTNTTVNGWVSGIFALNNVSTIYNNTIADLRMPNYAQPAQKLFGIRVGNANLYYNTVFLSGTNASSAAVYSFTAGSLKLNNNIFINTITPNSGGIATAYSRGDTTINTYTASSNNNLFAGTNIYYDGTNTDATLTAFKTRMATRDQASVTEVATPFISTVGSNAAFLQLAANAVSVANNAALPITSPAITTDYFGVNRSTTTPDIGASEFNGFVCITPNFIINPPNRAICAGGNTTFSVGATDTTAYQWQINTGSGFTNITNGGVYSGATTTTLAITGAIPAMSGYLYRAIAINVLNTCFANSNAGTLTLSNVTVASSSQTNASCFGGGNGTATVIPSGGTGGYTYSWSPSGGTAATATGLSANTYTVTITDGIGCTATRTFTITSPSAIVLTAASQTNIACNGGATGAAAVNSATGGTGGYTYDWTPGTPTSDGTTTVTGLTAGTWTCTATDANGCTRSQSFVVTQQSAISGSTVVSNIACNGGSNGVINLTSTGGTAPYTFNWGGGITTKDRTGLAAGTYSVIITDAIGCTRTISGIAVTQPAAISTSAWSQTNIACNGSATGAASISPSGGTTPYTYVWSNGATTQSITGLLANTYTVTVTDANSCTATRSFTITQPTAISLTPASQTNISCNGGATGAASVNNATGGTPGYTYNWNPGNPTGDGTTTVTGLTAGSWSCTVSDAYGCTTNQSFTITQPATLVGAAVVTDVACNGGTNGAINLTPSGGTAPYTFNWVGGVTTEDRTGLAAGTYSVTITDANSCTRIVSGITVSQPTSAVSGTTVVTNVGCNGGTTGAINLTPTGGTAPYTFNWGGGITTEDRTSLAAGTYSVTITDANGCTGVASGITITQPATALSGTAIITSVSCSGGNNGAINLTPAGGTAPYTFSWIGGITTEDRTGLASGNYFVTITDANGCPRGLNFFVPQPTTLGGTLNRTNATCFGGNNGTLNLTPTGGTAPYTYLWADGVTTEDRTNLIAGNYSVVVTDLNGCTVTLNQIVSQPASAVSGTTIITNVNCNGASNGAINLAPTGGTAPYTFNWGDGITTEDRTGLAAGTYSVIITDANSCTTTISGIVIAQPTFISGSTVVTNLVCNGASNGAINLTPSGGTAPYTFNWGGGITTEDRAGLTAGTYSVIITDANSCTTTISFITVTQPTALSGTTMVRNTSCFGGSNGDINLTPNGGTAPYTFNWGGGITTEDRIAIAAGTYSVTITDTNGCSTIISGIIVTQPASALSGTAMVTNVACNGGSNGAINITPTGGIPPYTFVWGNGVTTEDRTGLSAGTYGVIITDSNSCSIIVSGIIVTQPTNLTATRIRSSVSCYGGANGAVNLTPSGGTSPYTFNWNDGVTTEDRTGLSAGTYSVIITDSNSCTATSSNIIITQPASALSGATVVTDISCFGGNNGVINLTPVGGTAPYTFNWGGGITTEDRTGLVAGTYSVIITDANGCTTNTNATVTEPVVINNSVTQTSGVLTATQTGAAYQWYNCTTGIIAGATNQTFTPSTVGDYRVKTTLNGCSLDSNCITVTTLSANDFDTANFSYYPNPTTGILNLNYSTDIDTIQISTILGQVVLSKTINAKEGQVDLQFLPSGTYLIKVTANDKTKVIKVVKN